MTLALLACVTRAAEAELLAARLGLPVQLYADDGLKAALTALPATGAALVLAPEGLGLLALDLPGAAPVRIDAEGGALGFRLAQERARHEQIVRACGLLKAPGLTVFDATAGLLRDAAVLAAAGARVTVAERSPVIALLIEDALARAAPDSVLAGIRFLPGDARVRLSAMAAGDERPDVVCLDPMFPHREKTALVKKEMQVFRQVVGEDDDADDLLATALAVARRRVVVKRPRLAPPLAGRVPTFTLEGRAGRFDIYQTG